MADVVVCGPVSWNQIVYLDALPDARPQTVLAQDSYETLGGTSAGKALHLHDRGRSVRLRTVVGDDDTGRLILDALERAHVRTEPLCVAGPSERHLNLMTREGERVSVYLSTPAEPPPLDVETLRDACAVVLDLAPWTRTIAGGLQRGDLPVWTDLHDYDGSADFHRPFLEAATHVLLSADALDGPADFLHRLIDDGAQLGVCTFGADGALAVDAAHREWRVAAVPVEHLADTNGAGDAFFAGLLDASLDGLDTGACLEAAAAQAVVALQSRHLSPLIDAAAYDA
ncbi:carbohydrate kinase family protein [Luteipulveratus mongoliensis]|uniref:Carbohydrate kinase PfkB domain-containing protein n=1 Tax=Luteipulveratus mongoliensis TaxID=571913 RepID=A0A0K1JEC1_9MICO|nr:carbohydrate kinase family protein [Luteipulveratus mongoliensis]AKU15062.1 hypothetical protein VV02_02970 [Luteipulveratus mongoliensis]